VSFGRRAALVAVVAAAACSSTGRQTRQEFVDEANGICTEANARVTAVAAPDPADPELVANAISQIVAIQRAALDDLEGLRPPEGIEPHVDEWLDDLADVLDDEEKVADAVRDGDPDAAAEANAAAAETNAAAEELATDLGLTACTVAAPVPPLVPPGSDVPATDPGASTTTTAPGAPTTTSTPLTPTSPPTT
jgi:hypothetical protein